MNSIIHTVSMSLCMTYSTLSYYPLGPFMLLQMARFHSYLWLSNILFGTFLVAHWYKIFLPMQKTWVQSLSQENPLEKEMATHSSILAWETPKTEEPVRLLHIYIYVYICIYTYTYIHYIFLAVRNNDTIKIGNHLLSWISIAVFFR